MNPNDPTAVHAPALPRISLLVDRAVIRHRGDSVRHLVCTVEAPSAAPPDPSRRRPPLHLALVVDTSGSMAGARIAAAQAAAAQVVACLGADDRVSLVAFSVEATLRVDAARLDDAGRAKVAAAIAALTAQDVTDLAAGWLLGCEAVARRLAEVGDAERSHVVVLSDGHANHGIVAPEELARHASALRERGVRTSTVGIGEGYSPAQLQAIAESGGGRMHDATTPNEIAEVLMAELGDALATTVDGFELALRLPPGVRAETYGTAPTTADGDLVRVQLGALLGGSKRHCVVKLTFPAGAVGQTLRIDASASWRTPADGAAHDVALPPVELRYASTADCMTQPRDLALAHVVVLQWHAHVAHRAMARNQRRELREAQEFVRRELHYFAKYAHDVPGGPALARSLAAYAEQVGYAQSEFRAKEIMLASYKRGRGETDRRIRARESLEDQLGMGDWQLPWS